MPTEIVPAAALSTTELIERRKQFEDFVRQCMTPEVDYQKSKKKDGKDVLLQPGAEKISKFYGLTVRLTPTKEIEDWEKTFFYYQFKGELVWHRLLENGSYEDMVVAECYGSCNSRESKYSWRWLSEAELPQELKTRAKKGEFKTETREKWVIEFDMTPEDLKLAKRKGKEWKSGVREGKSGRKFMWYLNPGLTVYRIPNDDICDQVNTILKISGKRAFVGVVIRGTNASSIFTQDLDDVPAVEEKDDKKTEEATTAEPGTIDEAAKKAVRDNFANDLKNAKTLDEVNKLRKAVPAEMFNDENIYSLYAVRYKEISKKEV